MRLEVADVVGAVSRLADKGYDREYRIKDDHLFDLALNSPLDPRHIDVVHRAPFGERPDAGDASDIHAISDKKTHNKGLLIEAFDIFDEICDRELAERLVETRPLWRRRHIGRCSAGRKCRRFREGLLEIELMLRGVIRERTRRRGFRLLANELARRESLDQT